VIRRSIMGSWYRQETARHEAELAAPQRFPLTDDGERTAKLTRAVVWEQIAPSKVSRDALAAARYRDWAGKRR
jgi:hypothetical protein